MVGILRVERKSPVRGLIRAGLSVCGLGYWSGLICGGAVGSGVIVE